MQDRSFRFSHAITRAPSRSVLYGLRAHDIGPPDLAQMQAHHQHYIEILRQTGAQVVELPALEPYPDAVFVEDTALCLREVAVLMRSGAQSRAGEVGQIAPVLRGLYDQVLEISGSGFIEGGDILTTEREILIGLSARTNQAGVDECAQLVAPWGYRVRCIKIPKDVLHFKTDCSLLDGETILTTPRLAASGCFENYRVINTGEGEEAAANAIRFNEVLIMAAGFPKTAAALETAGFNVKQVENSECAKLDGGMSCLSLRFSPQSETND